MSEYWAKIGDGDKVVHVAVVTKEYMDSHSEMFDGEWVLTFVDVDDKTYAGVDYTYNRETGDFVAPEPNEHWKALVGWVD